MNYESAAVLLETLASGSETLANPAVVEAIGVATTVLRSAPAHPAAAGVRWTPEEDERLCSEFDAGTSVAEIARIHDRTRGAVTARLVKVGRINEGDARVRFR